MKNPYPKYLGGRWSGLSILTGFMKIIDIPKTIRKVANIGKAHVAGRLTLILQIYFYSSRFRV